LERVAGLVFSSYLYNLINPNNAPYFIIFFGAVDGGVPIAPPTNLRGRSELRLYFPNKVRAVRFFSKFFSNFLYFFSFSLASSCCLFWAKQILPF